VKMLRIINILFILFLGGYSMTQQRDEVDVAKYAKVELKEKDVTLQW